jgi:hypothetical protein
MVLADSLAKAKASKGTLFDKKIFYITPKVPIEVKLLKNVVVAFGGQVINLSASSLDRLDINT